MLNETRDQPRLPPFVSRLRVRDFRSIATCDVAIGPLSVIVGPNASGKSNFLDAIRFVADALATSPGRAISRRGELSALLRRSPEPGVTADAFTIELTMNVPPGQTSPWMSATYLVEIRRDEADEEDFVVAREELDIDGVQHFAVAADDDEDDDDLGNRHPPNRLLLATLSELGGKDPYRQLFRRLTAPRFYDLDPATLREIDQSVKPGDVLGPSGQHLGSVLRTLAERYPEVKETLDSALAALIENAVGIDHKPEGRYSTVQARFITGGERFFDPVISVFERESLSEGTLRAAGVLAALFQPAVLRGAIPLVAIEEPEKALYPSTLGGLYGSLVAASHRTQVIVTSQSSDLLDNEIADLSHLIVVANAEGVTRVDTVDAGARSLVDDKVMSLAELHRSGLMTPPSGPGGTL